MLDPLGSVGLVTSRLAASMFLWIVMSSGSALAQEESEDDVFLRWAEEALVPVETVELGVQWDDLSVFGEMVGDATVVALSEAVHLAAEPLDFRNRVFQYLVEEKGFTAIALESGFVESHVIHEFVRGGPGELSDVLANGLTWTFDRLPQNDALVRWLREYNADPRHARKLNFYGFDVPGSPGNPLANRGTDTALTEALDYLTRVDGDAAKIFHARLDAFLPQLHFDAPILLNGSDGHDLDSPRYARLSRQERDAVTAAISDLITLFERHEARYTAASSAAAYQWGYRAAIGARQVDGWLREVPVGWKPSDGLGFFSAAIDVRDRAQADNLGWIVRQEGPAGKVLVFAHRYHVSAAPVTASFSSATTANPVAGTYLRRRFGDRLMTVGNLIGGGRNGCTGGSSPLISATPETIDSLVGELGVPLLLLDLRAAPAAVAAWLDREHRVGEAADAQALVLGRAFDVLFYIDAVTPACPE